MTHYILAWLLIGMIIGVAGKLLWRGENPGGFVVPILLGIAGAMLAGVIAVIAGLPYAAGWMSLSGPPALGAVAMLVLYRLMIVRRSR